MKISNLRPLNKIRWESHTRKENKLTGSKERKENLNGLDVSLQHAGKDTKHVFDSILQCIGHAIAVVVACATLVIDLVKAVTHGIAWAGSGIVGATKDLMNEHSNMTHEATEKG